MRKILFFLIIPFVSFGQEINSSNLPIIIINTNNQNIPDSPRIICDMGIIYNPGERNYTTDEYNNYNGKINIEIRGSSSQMFPKKSYGFETQYETGENYNTSLLDLPAENDWVLNGPYSDKSLIRNSLAYYLGGKLGHYAPRTRFCELIINNNYMGIYVLTEKIKQDKSRVDIEIPSASDITGGYIIKIDKPTDSEYLDHWYSNFYTLSNSSLLSLQYHDPKESELTIEEKNYIQNFIYEMESVLVGSNDDAIFEYIDIDSFIDFFIINELAKNVDAYRISTFLYKDSDKHHSKLIAGPLWDFNLAFGNANYCGASDFDGWIMNLNTNSDCTNEIPVWWNELNKRSGYVEKLNARWEYLRGGALSTESIFNYIDSLSSETYEAQSRNFNQWNILHEYIWPNNYIGYNYPNEISYLKYWIYSRLNWIDLNINQIHSDIIVSCNDPDKKILKITNASGKTIDKTANTLLFYIYDNGCVEKKYLIQ